MLLTHSKTVTWYKRTKSKICGNVNHLVNTILEDSPWLTACDYEGGGHVVVAELLSVTQHYLLPSCEELREVEMETVFLPIAG